MEHGLSIWRMDTKLPEFKSLSGEINADVAVIGGGLCGILTAYFLSDAGLKTVVLEASRICSGQTGNTTAKITSQHNLIYDKLINQCGMKRAQQYADANQYAIKAYRNIINKLKIDCDYTECPAYLYSLDDAEILDRECNAAKSLGIDAFCTMKTELPFKVANALCFEKQARFHPIKFIKEIIKHLDIYEHTPVKTVKKTRVETENGTVNAKKIVFCCHYPFINFPGMYFLKMYQERSYVIALQNAAQINGMYIDIGSNGLSLRPQGDFLLLGGGSSRTGENSSGNKFKSLCDTAQVYWPNSSVSANWSAQDCMTADNIPYIGKYSSLEPDWYVATGFGKWGMTSSMVSSVLIRDLIIKGDSPWAEVFSPQRFDFPASANGIIKETGKSLKGLSKSFLYSPDISAEQIKDGCGGIVQYKGKKVGVYKNENGEVFAVIPKCPHLGCQLEWNPDDKSWDCPCHGSRFDYMGNLIDNPAQSNLRK